MIRQAEARGTARWTAAWAFFLSVMTAYSWVVLSARLPPAFVDYPDWVYQGVLLHGVLSGHTVAGYALKQYPVPNSTTTIVLGLMDGVMPWPWAAKLWVIGYLALATYASWKLLDALRIREWQLVVALPAIVFLNLNFWYGHISFEVGLCLVLLLLARLVRGAPAAGMSALLVLIFFTHMEACAAALLLLLLWCAVERKWRLLWTAAPTVLLTGWYSVARFRSGDVDVRGLPPADYSYGSPNFVVFKANTFLKTFGYVNASTMSGLSQSEQILGKPAFVLLIVVALALAALCIAAILRALLRRNVTASLSLTDVAAFQGIATPTPPVSWPQTRWNEVIRAFAWVLLVVSLLLPQIFLGVADPGSRLLLLASAMGLLLVPWRGLAANAIALLSIVLGVANLWQLALVQRNPMMPGSPPNLPAALLRYGHVEPATRIDYYQHLEQGEMNEPVFPTGMFEEVPPVKR